MPIAITTLVTGAIAVATVAAHVAIKLVKGRKLHKGRELQGHTRSVEDIDAPIAAGLAVVYVEDDKVECHNPHNQPIACTFQRQYAKVWPNGQTAYFNETETLEIPKRASIDIGEDIAAYSKDGQMATNYTEMGPEGAALSSAAMRYATIFASLFTASSLVGLGGRFELVKTKKVEGDVESYGFRLSTSFQLAEARLQFKDSNGNDVNTVTPFDPNAAATVANDEAADFPYSYDLTMPVGVTTLGILRDFSLGLMMEADSFALFRTERPTIAFEDSLAARV